MSVQYQVISKNNQARHYLQALLELTSTVKASNAAPYLYPPTAAFYETQLGNETTKVFAFDGDKIVGFAVLKFMLQWPDYLNELTYPVEQSAQVLFTLVHPDYRGRGINKKMTELRISEAKKAGLKYLFATVHPDNVPSLKTLESMGMKQIDQRLMFEPPMLRNLMLLVL